MISPPVNRPMTIRHSSNWRPEAGSSPSGNYSLSTKLQYSPTTSTDVAHLAENRPTRACIVIQQTATMPMTMCNACSDVTTKSDDQNSRAPPSCGPVIMARHAGIGRRHACIARCFDCGVTESAVDPRATDVMLLAGWNGSLYSPISMQTVVHTRPHHQTTPSVIKSPSPSNDILTAVFAAGGEDCRHLDAAVSPTRDSY